MAIVREEIMTFGSEQPLRSVERDEDMLLAPPHSTAGPYGGGWVPHGLD